VGGDAGLAALATAVELDMATKAGTKPVSFVVKVPSRLGIVCAFCVNMSEPSLQRARDDAH